MSLPLLHAGRTNPGLSAALDLRFALDKSLTAYRGPTPSFSRASTGSYFDGSGVLRYAALNLLTYSENVSDASWTKSNVTVTNDSIVSPDGKTTADTLTENSANATHFVNKASSTSAGTIYTSSIYAKAGTRKYIDITSVAQDGGVYRRFNNVFDLETGTWQSTASLNSPANTSYSITSVGNGWYRISSSILAYGSTHYLVVYLSNSANPTRDASNDVVYTGNGTGNLYIWGAQLEASSTVGTYCPTTTTANSAPRFNHTYNGTSWVSRGLLVEEQRTNVIQHSNDLNNAAWNSIRNVTITSNAAISPEGVSNANQLMETTASGTHGAIQISAKTSATYTLSVFVKPNGRDRVYLDLNIGSTDYIGYFDLTSKTYLGNGGFSSVDSYSIGDVGNGWLRLSITKNSALDNYGIFLGNGTSVSYAGDSSKGVYVYGFQLESGSFPTSYIPTTSASVTRSADVCQITGSSFSSFWNGTEGSVAAEFDYLNPVPSGIETAFLFNNTTSENERIWFSKSNASPYGQRAIFTASSSNVAVLSVSDSLPSSNQFYKTAAGFKLNDFAATLNGASVVTDTSGAMPSVSQLSIGWYPPFTTGTYLNGHIAKLVYYPARLTNTKLQQLST